MRKQMGYFGLIACLIFIPLHGKTQQQAAYKLPDSFQFDYEVVQQVSGDSKSSNGTHSIVYNYSQKGDYMAIRAADKNNNLIIYSKDGTSIIIDNQKKSITIFNMGNMLAGMSQITDQYNKKGQGNQPARSDSSNFQVAKTGKSKQIGGYQAEEYSYTNSKGEKATVWYAKVDFNTSLLRQFGAGAASSPRQSMNKIPQNPSFPQLNDPNLLAVEITNSSHPGEGLTTQSIAKKTMVIDTKGYTVNDLSHMMGH